MSQVTKRALVASLKNQLLKKPLDKVTISDITDDCGISRMTFYYHFKDIYDLIEWAFEEEASRILEGKKDYDTWQQGYLRIFEDLNANKPFIMNVYRSISREKVENYLYRITYDLLIHVINEKAKGMNVRDEDKKFLFDQLKANFEGECSEVGMYLAMARVAHREGYPEIGLYWEKAAYEEAEHAAKFAEMLGEVVTDSTKKNLEMRVAAENGATAGKTALAKMAKEDGLDAIHDTVHEMARDEARHGKAFEGLLKRYFG